MERVISRFLQGVRRTGTVRAFPLPAIGVAFLAGVALGWLVIGWWLWPVSWTDADPWDLRAEYQKVYVTLTTESYTQSRNTDLVKEALDGWDSQALADLMMTLQDQAPDPATRQRLADMASALALPSGGAAEQTESTGLGESAFSLPVPPVGNRLVTVCGTAGAMLVVFVLIIFAVSTRPWESISVWIQRAQRSRAVKTPELVTGHFVSTYIQGRDDAQEYPGYDDYFSIEAPNGQFLGECGLCVGRILGRETPRRVTALEMVLFDSFDHRTETRILMSRHAYEDAGLRQELMTRGELILVEPGVQSLVETINLQMLATITSAEYADQEPPEGVFRRVTVELDIRIKHLPGEVTPGLDHIQEDQAQEGEAESDLV